MTLRPARRARRHTRLRTKDVPLRRPSTPEEIAGTAGWLLSDDAASVKGAVISVDGGSTVVDVGGARLRRRMSHERPRRRSPASRSRRTTSSAASASRARTRSPISRRSTSSRSARSPAAGSGRPISRLRRRPRPSRPGRPSAPPGAPRYLHRLADLIDANVERLAAVECVDMAMLLRSLKARLINRGARNYRSYADLAVAYEERVWDSNGTHNRVIRMPSGPAVVITPWNAPFMLSTWKTAPALAAGSTMILKPAEWSPLSCSLLADLVDEAGFPPGVFNIVQGIGEEIGAALVVAPGVRRDLVHGLARDCPAHRRRGREEHRPLHRRARRQGAAARLRGLRPRGGRAEGGGPVRRRRPGLPRRHAASSSRSRSPSRSSSSSTASPTSTFSATRATTTRRSPR